jgi:hypothetical protein
VFFKKISETANRGTSRRLFSRNELMEVFPHRGIALVTSSARFVKGAAEFTLLPGEFTTYCTGHDWRFPGHWLAEMACQVSGLQAALQLYQTMGDAAWEYKNSLLIRNGDWTNKPLNTNPKSEEPIVAKVVKDSFSIRTKRELTFYVSSVEFRQGTETALYEGIRVVLKKSADNAD